MSRFKHRNNVHQKAVQIMDQVYRESKYDIASARREGHIPGNWAIPICYQLYRPIELDGAMFTIYTGIDNVVELYVQKGDRAYRVMRGSENIRRLLLIVGRQELATVLKSFMAIAAATGDTSIRDMVVDYKNSLFESKSHV